MRNDVKRFFEMEDKDKDGLISWKEFPGDKGADVEEDEEGKNDGEKKEKEMEEMIPHTEF